MTIEYAKAYHRERIAHARAKRLQRGAVPAQGAGGIALVAHPIRRAISSWLISLGEQLAPTHAPPPAKIVGEAHI